MSFAWATWSTTLSHQNAIFRQTNGEKNPPSCIKAARRAIKANVATATTIERCERKINAWMSSLTEYQKWARKSRKHKIAATIVIVLVVVVAAALILRISFTEWPIDSISFVFSFWMRMFRGKTEKCRQNVNFNDFLNPLTAIERLRSTLFWFFQRIEFLERWCHAAQDERRRRRKKPSELVATSQLSENYGQCLRVFFRSGLGLAQWIRRKIYFPPNYLIFLFCGKNDF